jgi:glucose dehydrogenase
MKKKIIVITLSILVILILLDSTKIKYKYVNKFFLEVNPKYLSASLFKKSYKYLNNKYEIYLTKYSKKHNQYWNLENPEDRMGLKTKYTIDKTKNFTKNTNLNPINLKDWPRSHGNNHSNRFSDLSLINKKNISSLEVAWIYHSNSKKGAGSDIQCNPIIVNGIIYSPVVGGYIAAIDGYSGKEIWRSKKLNRDVARRGLVYWEGNDKIDAKILFNDGPKLISLNVEDGKLTKNFGKNGKVRTGYSKITPIIYKDTIIVASWKKNLEVYDISSGKLKWRYFFGDSKNERNGGKLYDNNKGGNPWGGISADTERGIVYITTGNAAKYFDGTKRPGPNKNSSSLIAIDLENKKELWSFQETIHDIWNLDLPGPPILTSIIREGSKIDVVIAATKRTNTLILDRVTGKNIFDLDYKLVEQSTVPGEKTSLYQLNLKLPEQFGKNIFNKDDITNISNESKDYITSIVNKSQFGFFKPVNLNKNTIMYNFHGGAEWMGASIDHKTQTMYVNNNNIAFNGKLVKNESKFNEYRSVFSRLVDKNGYPGSAPPWGTISSMNLNTGKINWTKPFGYYPELKKRNIITGTENFGGVTATKGDLIFATGTLDSNIYAYDTTSGEQLWERKLPFIGSAPPSIYLAKEEQFIVVQSTGSFSLNQGYPHINIYGDAIVAFKLKK